MGWMCVCVPENSRFFPLITQFGLGWVNDCLDFSRVALHRNGNYKKFTIIMGTKKLGGEARTCLHGTVNPEESMA
jgi:hypothetical protein